MVVMVVMVGMPFDRSSPPPLSQPVTPRGSVGFGVVAGPEDRWGRLKGYSDQCLHMGFHRFDGQVGGGSYKKLEDEGGGYKWGRVYNANLFRCEPSSSPLIRG